jgi:hypothetical protein
MGGWGGGGVNTTSVCVLFNISVFTLSTEYYAKLDRFTNKENNYK